MALSGGMWTGIIASVLVLLLGILFFVQTRDPMILIFSLQPIALLWVVVFIVHVLRRGIPVRIVEDERKEP